MTLYILKDHPFRSTASGRWTRRTIAGRKQLLRNNAPGSEYLHCNINFNTDVDLRPAEEKFRTIFGGRSLASPDNNITIGFKCCDCTLVTNNNNLKLAVPSAVVTAEMNAKIWEERQQYFFEQTVVVDHPSEFFQYRNNEWQGKVSVKLIPGAGSGGGASLTDLVPIGNLVNKKGLEEELWTDFSLVAQNGTEIRAHKMILAAQSPVFQTMLRTDCRETQENSCKLNNSEEGVRAFLKFLYYSDIEDPLGNASVGLELLELGHKYEIPSLENVMKAMFLSVEFFSVDVAVSLFRYSCMIEGYEVLKMRAVQSIKLRKSELKESATFSELIRGYPMIATELFTLAL